MIRFWTRSLRYSTDVPGVTDDDGLCAPAMLDPTVSECKDCASHSRAWEVTVGDVVEKGKLEALEAKEAVGFKDWGVIEPEEEEVLKEERKFWAEDLRRIAGRCGCSENMMCPSGSNSPVNCKLRPASLTDGMQSGGYITCPFVSLTWTSKQYVDRYQCHRKAVRRLLLRDICLGTSQFGCTLCSSIQPTQPINQIWYFFSAGWFHAHLWRNSNPRKRSYRRKT